MSRAHSWITIGIITSDLWTRRTIIGRASLRVSRASTGPEKIYAGEYVDTLLTRKAVEWLQQKRDKPFCMFLWFYATHAPFFRPKDLVNDLNGVSIPVPVSFNEDEKGYPGKPRAVADADNKMGYSEVYIDDPRSLEELVKDHYVGVKDNDRNVGAALS